MVSTRPLACLAVLLCTLVVAEYVAQLPVWAVPSVRAAPPVLVVPVPVSLEEAVRRVQERYNGKVVRTETVQEDGHTVYILRVLSDTGHVWTVRVDAEDGSIH
jgi:hypothetical protein